MTTRVILNINYSAPDLLQFLPYLLLKNCIIFSLTRDVAVANDYASAAYLVEADIHYQIDSLGSKEELVK